MLENLLNLRKVYCAHFELRCCFPTKNANNCQKFVISVLTYSTNPAPYKHSLFMDYNNLNNLVT